MIHIILADGFEEIEALATADILRRAGLEVSTVSANASLQANGAHGIAVTCDCMLQDTDLDTSRLVVLPGGMPGALNLRKSTTLCDALQRRAAEGKLIAAICAAPYILGELGLLKGRRATSYPGFEDKLHGATCTGAGVEHDGNIITGRGPAAAIDFALKLAEITAGSQKAREVALGMLCTVTEKA